MRSVILVVLLFYFILLWRDYDKWIMQTGDSCRVIVIHASCGRVIHMVLFFFYFLIIVACL